MNVLVIRFEMFGLEVQTRLIASNLCCVQPHNFVNRLIVGSTVARLGWRIEAS